MNLVDLTKPGGLRFTQDILAFMQNSYVDCITKVAGSLGDKIILDGVVNNGAGLLSDGWILYMGEPILFSGGQLAAKVKIVETKDPVQFKNGLSQPILINRVATCDVIGDFNFSELKRFASFTTDVKEKYDNYWRTGDIKEVDCTMQYVMDNFDNTGLGINERVGWAVCNGNNGTRNRQGRTSIGLQYPTQNVNPNNNLWDALYNTIGNTVGKNKHQLATQELPVTNIVIPTVGYAGIGGSGTKLVGNAATPSGADLTLSFGSNQEHENRQPSIVTLIIQKL